MEQKQLFPVIDVPEFADENAYEVRRYLTSIYWDDKTGDFRRDGTGRIVPSDGKDTYIQWCDKVIRTERYVHMAYPDEIGVETEAALDQTSSSAAEAMIENTFTEALMVNPRTESVRDFNFQWEGDQLHVEFEVKGIDWEEFKISTTLRRKEVAEDDS